jgi:hypothetical protein
MLKLVSRRIFLRNSLEHDLLVLYERLVNLGMGYRDGQAYLANVDDIKRQPP